MNATVKNKLVSKHIYKTFSSAIKPLGAVQKKFTGIKEKNKEKLALAAITCSLTGALNSKGLRELFDKIVPSALKKVSIIYIEIDRIAEMQETLTQKYVDKILKSFVDEVNRICQNTDIITRWSPNEFVLVCPETTLKSAEQLAIEIRNTIRRLEWARGTFLSCSTGVTEVYGTPIHELIGSTKQSIKAIKNTRGGKAFVAEPKFLEQDNNLIRSAYENNTLPKGLLSRVDLQLFLGKIPDDDLQQTSVVFIQISEFTDIFNNHGQKVSHEVLNDFSESVKRLARSFDILAQWSSTEYILVCPRTTLCRAIDLAKEIQSNIESRTWKNDIKITCHTDVYDSQSINLSENESTVVEVEKEVIQADETIIKKSINQHIDITEMTCPETGLLNSIGLGNYFDNQDTVAIQNTSVVIIDVDYCGVADKNFARNTANNILIDIIEEINVKKSGDYIMGLWSDHEYMLICPETSLKYAKRIAAVIKQVLEKRSLLKGINITCNTEALNQSINIDFVDDETDIESNNTIFAA